MTEIWRWSAAEVSAAVKAGEISAREAAESVLARIDQVNPAVNAIVEVTRAEALAAADAADAAVKAGGPLGPLHGVPVTIKVNVDQTGHATTNGLVALANTVAETDSPPVANLKKAGAVIVGRTNTPAFSLRWFTENDLHGRTLNPWGAALSPGGSSGGAASALATGMGAIGHGNDYGGSIRHPALMCGVVGFRPSYGKVPAYNPTVAGERPISGQLYSVQGPLARTVEDAATALEAMSAPDPRDPYHVTAPTPRPSRNPRRVAVMRGCGLTETSPQVAAAIDTAADMLADAGYEIEETAPPHFDEATEIWRETVYEDTRRTGAAAIEEMGDAPVKTNLRLIWEGRAPMSGDAVLDLYARRLGIARAWSEFFAERPLILTATSWRHALQYGDDQTDADALTQLIHDQSPLLATAMLGLPGLSVPTGLADGAPTGVQIIGGWHDEATIAQAGAVLERALPPFTPINPVFP